MSETKPPLKDRILPAIRSAAYEVWLFVSSGIFLKNLAAALLLLTVLYLGLNYWLNSYTRHGESVEVANFIDRTVDDSRNMASSNKLRVQILDSVWVGSQTEQLVLEQSPKPGSRVKEDRTIYLTITKVVPPEVLLPPFKDYGYDYVRYAQMLQGLDLKATISRELYDPKQAPGTILYFLRDGKKFTDADLAEGVKMPKGSELNFVITEKASSVALPNLVCKTYDEARFIIESYGLSVGSINGSSSPTAYVYQQRPSAEAGRRARTGSPVDVFLSDELPLGCN